MWNRMGIANAAALAAPGEPVMEAPNDREPLSEAAAGSAQPKRVSKSARRRRNQTERRRHAKQTEVLSAPANGIGAPAAIASSGSDSDTNGQSPPANQRYTQFRPKPAEAAVLSLREFIDQGQQDPEWLSNMQRPPRESGDPVLSPRQILHNMRGLESRMSAFLPNLGQGSILAYDKWAVDEGTAHGPLRSAKYRRLVAIARGELPSDEEDDDESGEEE